MVSSRAPTGTGATDNAGIDNTGWSLAPAAADYDLDGDVDLFVGNDFGKDVLYRNDGTGHFDEVARAVGAIGAVVTVHVGGERQTRHVAAGSGFLASSSRYCTSVSVRRLRRTGWRSNGRRADGRRTSMSPPINQSRYARLREASEEAPCPLPRTG